MIENLPPYTLKLSARSRNVRLQVSAGGLVTVTAPRSAPKSTIEQFLIDHLAWLKSKIEHFKKIPKPSISLAEEKKLFVEHRHRAKNVAEEKIRHWNNHYQFAYKKIAIRNSRSRWGSCSRKGTVSFNYKIAFLPEHLADYLVVHELCHLGEANHGQNFWSLVEKTIPDYQTRRQALREFEKTFNHLNVGTNQNIL